MTTILDRAVAGLQADIDTLRKTIDADAAGMRAELQEITALCLRVMPLAGHC